MEFGYIYKITCKPTGKVYVGQTREYKHKQGKEYNYGIQGRWNDHVSSARTNTNDFANDIRKYGRDAFQVEQLERAELNTLDALEAKWIEHHNCIVPNGYNKSRHSQNKHREHSNLHEYYRDKVTSCSLRKIHKNGKHALVYVLMILDDGTVRRVVFGNNRDTTFEEAWESANEFAEKLWCPYSEDTSHSVDPLERYADKINEYANTQITKIRITSASQLIAVYITTSDMKTWKDQHRICFGGKTIDKDSAYDLALMFVDQLPKSNQTVLQDTYRSRQQVAASMSEASSQGENSVNASVSSAQFISQN